MLRFIHSFASFFLVIMLIFCHSTPPSHCRYMAPEVILEKPYNEKSDVHSFAVLCWEACAAKKPYSGLDAKKVKEHVSKWHERPNPYWSWPRRLRKIMKQGWTKRQEDRPTMAEFHKALVKVQASLPKSSIDFTKTK